MPPPNTPPPGPASPPSHNSLGVQSESGLVSLLDRVSSNGSAAAPVLGTCLPVFPPFFFLSPIAKVLWENPVQPDLQPFESCRKGVFWTGVLEPRRTPCE